MADLVLVNGQVWTVDQKKPEVSALAISQNKILAVGQNSEIKKVIGPATKVIDLKVLLFCRDLLMLTPIF